MVAIGSLCRALERGLRRQEGKSKPSLSAASFYQNGFPTSPLHTITQGTIQSLRPEILVVVGVLSTVSRPAKLSQRQHLSTTRVSRNKDPRRKGAGIFMFHPPFRDETYRNDDSGMSEAVEGRNLGITRKVLTPRRVTVNLEVEGKRHGR